MKKELIIPPASEDAKEAIEVLRAWVIDKELHCSIAPEIWKDDPGCWGIVLADVANHISDALEQSEKLNKEQVLSSIRDMFNRELQSPTDTPSGDYVD
ncbi:DUF5076 domain-containing protein [Rubellicoccus peritrichatus]|uniref:DUF5076 domain-containing protein n=1 Tax=Rubellicoccus peritrichatus TaxID=3080537 RepID=A0AAQ3QRB1_9BACT|nr:DUF5076 domain-containing protein [Puniceicoccus sp. CR14]WOO41138.1 DUF5076 domain-containing protein [Puniceicoccus sp. CR14]